MIYLDHAAATPVSQEALKAMMPYFSGEFFNPSAPYLPAQYVRRAYEKAKDEIAHAIGAKAADLVITGGATESINLAFTVCQGVYENNGARETRCASDNTSEARVLVTAIEHAAVLASAQQYNYGLIKVDRSGLINLKDFENKITDETVLVSVALANNELGAIQPLAEVAEIIRKVRDDRLARGVTTPLYLHSDASQALNLMDLNVARLGVDLLTLNAAKCGGPKGVGALYIAHHVPVKPVNYGGGQENGLRSGTENVPAVIGFATAITEAKKHLAGNRRHYAELARILKESMAQKAQELDARMPEPIFLGNPKHQLANFIPVSFPDIDAERLIYKLEAKGILVSTGAACAANKGSKSHVLDAIGLSDAEIAGSLRLSLGSTNDAEQMLEAGKAIMEAVSEEWQRIRHE